MGDIFEYSDPIISEWRRGDSTQPFIHYQDITFQVARTAVVLNEVPVKQNRVFVKDPSNGQIFYEVENKAPESLEFRVDYSNGMIFFHESAEGKRLAFTYFGRGAQFFPASRIWTKELNGRVEQTLGDLVEGASEFYFLGAYEPGRQYKVYNMVSFQGGTYICIKDTNVSPPNDEYWRQISGMMWRGTYSSAISYGAGDYVNDTKKENIYQSLVDNNVGNSLADKSKWLLVISVSDTVKAAKAATDKANASAANADTSAANANEKALFAETQGNFAKTQGDYSKEQGDYALAQGNHAKTQGDYAGVQGKRAQDVVDNFVNKGEYSATVTYLPNNVVTYNGSSYMCILESKGNPPSNNKFWKLAASKGDSINWRGDYDSSTSYKKDDAVSYLGSSYICIVDSTGKLPTETSYWNLMSAKGIDGTGAGTVTSVTSANEDIKIELSTTTPVLTLNTGTDADQILKLDSNAQITSDILKDGNKNKVFTMADKEKLDGISKNANKTTVLNENSGCIEIDGTSKRVVSEDFLHALENSSPTLTTFKPGLQIVESAQDTPFQFGKIQGSTRINLNGKGGNFDYRTTPLFTFFGTSEIVPSNGPVGIKCQKVVCNRTDTAHFGARYELDIDRSKHYIAMAYMENVNCDVPVYFSIAEFKASGYTSIQKSASLDKGPGMQYLYTTVTPAQMENREKLVYYFRGEGTSGAEFRIGPFAFYEVTQAEYDTIAKMTPEQVAERYPYVDSKASVKNPYAIVTGGNLLPPFTDGWSIASQATVASPYHLRLTPTSNYNGSYVNIPCVPNTTYTLQGSVTGGGKLYADVRGSNGSHEYHLVENGIITFSTSADSTAIDVLCTNDTTIAGDMEFLDVMLTIGPEPTLFVPQQRSMLAFETELAAHPVDGSNSDTLFLGDDGLPYVLEKWGKVTLDGSLSYRLGTKTTAWKQVYFDISQGVLDSEIVIKFNGTRLTSNQYMDGSDQSAIDSVDKNRVYLTIANTDSGWGQDYDPTQGEIKAYFLGWKMFDGTVGAEHPYNRTDGQYKSWVRITDWSNRVDNVVPTSSYDGYTPYRLQYLKAKPTVEPVRNYEMGATLSAGLNMVEVGSGIVIREKANPVDIGNGYVNLNDKGLPPSPLRYPTNKILAIYQNQAFDPQWNIMLNHPSGYGGAVAQISRFNFDPTAVYHVTYTMLDPALQAPISGTTAANLRGTVSDLVQDVGDIGRRLSVVENQKAEKSEPEWIKPTLQSGWTNYDTKLYSSAGYYKDGNGIVRIKGLVKGGPIQSLIFMLPAGYRPKTTLIFPAIDASYTSVRVDITHSGEVVLNTANANTDYLSLDGISFLAEQ
ncbi:hypothetical protein [Paenibacillus dendritiformis]|uniref:hypothetical protein n=1 Tax=Paenibacillus dendritiformis TaxID=130049 RepID=UPI00387E0B2F